MVINLREDRDEDYPIPKHYTWDQFNLVLPTLCSFIMTRPPWERQGLYGVPRGGLPLAVALSHRLNLPLFPEMCLGAVIVDDIYDSGRTMHRLWNEFPGSAGVCWLHRLDLTKIPITPPPSYKHGQVIGANLWAIFPWEDPDRAMDDYRAYRDKLNQGVSS